MFGILRGSPRTTGEPHCSRGLLGSRIRWLSLCIASTSLAVFSAIPVQGDGPIARPGIDDLKQRWETHMIAGKSVNERYVPVANRYEPLEPAAGGSPWPYSRADGRPADAFATTGGIVVSVPARQPFILWRRDGWTLTGGLLRRIAADDGELDLYGRLVLKEDGFYPPTRIHREPPTTLVAVEFFLLRRSKGERKVAIVRRWMFAPPYGRDPQTIRFEASGDITYDAGRRIVTVTFRGLGDSIVEVVPLAHSS